MIFDISLGHRLSFSTTINKLEEKVKYDGQNEGVRDDVCYRVAPHLIKQVQPPVIDDRLLAISVLYISLVVTKNWVCLFSNPLKNHWEPHSTSWVALALIFR